MESGDGTSCAANFAGGAGGGGTEEQSGGEGKNDRDGTDDNLAVQSGDSMQRTFAGATEAIAWRSCEEDSGSWTDRRLLHSGKQPSRCRASA